MKLQEENKPGSMQKYKAVGARNEIIVSTLFKKMRICCNSHMLSTMTRQCAMYIHSCLEPLSPDQVQYLILPSLMRTLRMNVSRKRFTAYDTQSYYFIMVAGSLVT